VQESTFINGADSAVDVFGENDSEVRFTIQNNSMAAYADETIMIRNADTNGMQGSILSNSVGQPGNPLSGSASSYGIALYTAGPSDTVIRTEGNSVYNAFLSGVSEFVGFATPGAGVADLTVVNNILPTSPVVTTGSFPNMNVDAAGTDVCARVEGNIVAPGINTAGTPLAIQVVRQTNVLKLDGYEIGSQRLFLRSRNPDTASAAIDAFGIISFAPPGTCRTPAATPLP
jgi:hypothetical protein